MAQTSSRNTSSINLEKLNHEIERLIVIGKLAPEYVEKVQQELRSLKNARMLEEAFSQCRGNPACLVWALNRFARGHLTLDWIPAGRNRWRVLQSLQRQNAAAFRTVELEGPSMNRLPEGIPAKLVSGYERIRTLFTDSKTLLSYLQTLERMVVVHSVRNRLSLEESLVKILSEWEAQGGFSPAIDYRDPGSNFDLFSATLRSGALFNDLMADKSRGGHGPLTHRLQWHLIMRDMKEHPEYYTGVNSAVEYYKSLGDQVLLAHLDWSKVGPVGINSLWYQLLDSNSLNLSRPEFFHPLHWYFPGLGDW